MSYESTAPSAVKLLLTVLPTMEASTRACGVGEDGLVAGGRHCCLVELSCRSLRVVFRGFVMLFRRQQGMDVAAVCCSQLE
ncbi:hypothetical protein OPV22_005348 [Ensete ventricosum]|uniref:Secreted protein n=1 Tax=Ensete ventricosum TaxID=4639 RepID=A0AAV8Q129_ENSVE|nr:hypothetical protein OPV22_005348 [Ensete ventricosum]